MKIAVIIPTYNESRAIGNLLDAVENEIKDISHETFVVVVDGNSTDGTIETVREKERRYRNIRLLVEKEKAGLGSAYCAGIAYAIYKLGVDAFIEFDGDFQHDPKDIPRLVVEFEKGYDYVIGSRYVSGGSVPDEWAWQRKILSRFGSLFIRWALWLPTHDNTSGLKLSRVYGFAKRLPLAPERLISRRHAYKIEFLYIMLKNGAKAKEIPIRFLSRKGGDSKSTAEDILESLRVILILRLHNLWRS
ncbi:MAG: polyprenol monophosphomannose synthase [Candidatus Harrisonbacteria bacterium]|nr:polyprenol monophosphomannose synthase [Candidatus Harrisonbacteria bacterium]